MGDDIWEHYAKEYQAREARWEPVRSGVPYTCNECPALIEMAGKRDHWKQMYEIVAARLYKIENEAVRGE